MTSSVLPGLEQLAKRRQQLRDVVEVQAGRGLVEDVQHALAAVAHQMRRDLHALRLTARQRRRGLPEAQVAEPHFVQDVQSSEDLRRTAEELQRLSHREVEDLRDVLALVFHLPHLGREARPVAMLARHRDVGQELHLHRHDAFSLARFAPAARDIEGEVAGRETSRARVLGGRQELADGIERLQIRDGIRARRASDRRLVHEHDVREELGALEPPVEAHAAIPIALEPLDPRIEHVVHERRFSRAAHASDAGQRVERDLDVDVLQVVLARPDQTQAPRRAFPPHGGD